MAFSSGAQRNLFVTPYYYTDDSDSATRTGLTEYEVRNTDDSFSLARDSFVSDERRGDRGIHDLRLGNKQPAGDMGFEFSYESFDHFLMAALGNNNTDLTWSSGESITMGTNRVDFKIVKDFSDIDEYQTFDYGVVNTMSLDINPNAMVTGSFGMIFKSMAASTGEYSGSATIKGDGNPPFDGFKGSIKEDGVTNSVISSLSLSLDNGIERNFVLMSDEHANVTTGKSNLTGSVTLYFQDTTEYEKFVDEEESSLQIILSEDTSSTGNRYTIDIPRIKYTSADVPVNSDGAVMVTMNFQALYDSTDTNIKITKNDAA